MNWGPFTPNRNNSILPTLAQPNYNWSGIGMGDGSSTGGIVGGGNLEFFNPNNTKFGWNANTLNFGLQGLQGIGNLWGAWQSNKLAKDQLNFTKDFANRNLANQTKAYNTALEDRGRARAAVEGQTSAEAQAYIDRNRLKG